MLTIDLNKKIAGILVPLFALRGKNDLGVGDTAALSELIEWASQHDFHLLQLLPINETGDNNSPYHLLSAMALEPSTITTHPTWLPELTSNDYQKITERYDLNSLRSGRVNYSTAKKLKNELLTVAWKRFQRRDQRSSRSRLYKIFQEEQHTWLADYTLYRVLLERNGNNENLETWNPNICTAASAETWLATLSKKERAEFETRRDFFAYVQWIAFSQWKKISELANRLDVALMGDVPIGISLGGADIFSSPELFDTKNFGGAPPEKVFQADSFTMRWGQNWGVPIYKWEQMSKNNFAWWRHRLRLLKSIFHLLRIDHTLGLFRIYSFPWSPERNAEFTDLTPEQAAEKTGGRLPRFVDQNDDTPEHIAHNKYRGEMLLRIFLEEIGKHCLIAEDLGETPPYVPDVLSMLEIPGFKIPLWVRHKDGSMIKAKDYPRVSVATYGTHDHLPFRTQWETWQAEARSESSKAAGALKTLQELLHFIGHPELNPFDDYEKIIHHVLLQGLYSTNSWLAILTITDLFGSTQIFNVPGTLNKENWTARIEPPIASWNKIHPTITGSRS